MSHGEMWKNDDSQPPSSRGSIVSFGNSELATINEKEQKSDNQVSLVGEIETIESPAITRIKGSRFPSNNSLSMMCKNARRGRSASMPFIQKALPDLNSQTTKIFLETMSIAVSGLYCKLLVVLGICFPVAEVLSDQIPQSNYEVFYLYLYSVSLLYLVFVYATLLKQRAVDTVLHNSKDDTIPVASQTQNSPAGRYGSFYLRMGAIAFGIGSMIHCGLEFGRYFELEDHPDCRSVLMVLTPSIKMTFIIIQLQFIFMSNKHKALSSYKNISKFGLMHMIATNLSVWSSVVVQETKREIVTHYEKNSTNILESYIDDSDNSSFNNICTKSYIMGSLVTNAAPFLFPCTIEYSLICSVILYALWKSICHNRERVPQTGAYANKISKPVVGMTTQHFTVDFANAHKGLFGGIIILVFTIISLIMFYTLIQHEEFFSTAVFQVNLCELVLYALGILASILAMYRIRQLKYERKRLQELDTMLLVTAQTDAFYY
ncbi:otopetrin-2-like isoform X2 [Cimex lectularius]|uniref:Uncharacterized protein n=1 Tax=Cimex lectularius TaxID=79782 RepID=A0A8I6SNN9_CIMLE|nr:otopetrin-2-like isoform X2 [Cimex lectularius]